jgi:hypothetical protein
MGRFTPQVVPNSGAAIGRFGAQLASIFEENREHEREQKIDAERDADREYDIEQRNERDELEDIARQKVGIYRGKAPSSDHDAFAGQRPGMAQHGGEGAGMGLADGIRDFLGGGATSLEGDPGEPEVIALPGQYVRGIGVTKRAILAPPPQPQLRTMADANQPAPRQNFRQLTENFYEAEVETPEYKAEQQREQAAARQELELADMLKAYKGAGLNDGQAQVALRRPELVDDFMRQDDDAGPKPPVRGTKEWYDMLREEAAIAGRARVQYRTTNGSGDDEDEGDETGHRQRVLGAAREIAALQEDDFEASSGGMQLQAQRIARAYGFDSHADLDAALKAIGQPGSGRTATRSATTPPPKNSTPPPATPPKPNGGKPNQNKPTAPAAGKFTTKAERMAEMKRWADSGMARAGVIQKAQQLGWMPKDTTAGR